MRFFIAFCGLAALAHGQSQVVSAGYSIPVYQSASPGQVITLFVRGLNALDAFATGTPLPTTLAGITVKAKDTLPNPNYPDRLPIFSVRSYDFCAGRFPVPCPLTHVTVQIPNEPLCVFTGQTPNECDFLLPQAIILNVQENGVPGQDFPVFVKASQPRIINACDTIFGTIGGICDPYVTHADGSLVGSGCANAVKPGETIVIYGVGFGSTNPPVKTGEATPLDWQPAAPSHALLIVSFREILPPASPAPPSVWLPVGGWVFSDYVGLVPGYVGLYQINVRVPTELPPNTVLNGFATMRIALGAGDLSGPADGSSFVNLCLTAQ